MPPIRRYWAFLAHPDWYRIEDAVRELEIDTWTTKGKAINVGDRVAIWKALGSKKQSGTRGVVALGEVVSLPEMRSDADNPYWLQPPGPGVLEERVQVRYTLLPGLPLWLHGPGDEVLRALSVSRATGGTVFYVTADQWHRLVAAAGGWPDED